MRHNRPSGWEQRLVRTYIAMVHSLKTWPEYFEAVRQERKTFEIRENDRAFKVGDWLQLHEWCPKSKDYTGRVILTRITYLTGFEQKPGFVVMAITPPESVVDGANVQSVPPERSAPGA